MSSSGAEWPGPGQYYSKWSRYFLDRNLSWNIFTNPLPTGSLLAPGSGQASSSLRSSSPSHLLPGIEFLYLSCMCREPPLTRASGSLVVTELCWQRKLKYGPSSQQTGGRYFIRPNNMTIFHVKFITEQIATFLATALHCFLTFELSTSIKRPDFFCWTKCSNSLLIFVWRGEDSAECSPPGENYDIWTSRGSYCSSLMALTNSPQHSSPTSHIFELKERFPSDNTQLWDTQVFDKLFIHTMGRDKVSGWTPKTSWFYFLDINLRSQ